MKGKFVKAVVICIVACTGLSISSVASAVDRTGVKIYDAATGGSTMAGTEVQALEIYDNVLYAGTTNWRESNLNIWPAHSAQVLYLETQSGTWQPTGEIDAELRPYYPEALYEQVNDLLTVSNNNSIALFCSTFPNEDGANGRIQGSVHYLRPDNTWGNTNLDQAIGNYYTAVQCEVRYITSYQDANGVYLLAAVNPRDIDTPVFHGPTVWKGRITNINPVTVAWSSTPEIDFNGTGGVHVDADRILCLITTSQGIFIGTGAHFYADYSTIIKRTLSGVYSVLHQFPSEGQPNYEKEVRGLALINQPSANRYHLWALTNSAGRVHRFDFDYTTGQLIQGPVTEVNLSSLFGVGANFYGYQLYVHSKAGQTPRLLVASEDVRYNSKGRIYYRLLQTGSPVWGVTTITNLVNDTATDGVCESAVRWINVSPFNPDEIIFGTTDMNGDSHPKQTRTAEVWRLNY